jgi:hypothetical protein
MELRNIKYDLIEDILKDKYYLEKDFINLFKNENIPYKEKIFKLKKILKKIVITDAINDLADEMIVLDDNKKEEKE